MPSNYGEKATLVSLFPLPIFEKKPLIPSIYQIPAAKEELEPQVLVVGEGRFHVYLDEFRGVMTIKTPALTIAESIVRDFMDSQYMASEDARPAVWFLPGEWTIDDVVNEDSRLMIEHARQLEWFKRLIVIADDEWAKFHQHRMITEVQKVAATRLRLNREWAIEYTPENNIDCPGCGTLISKRVAVCHQCNCVINKELYESLTFAK